MIKLFIDLAALRLAFEPIPMKLLSVLTQVRGALHYFAVF